MLKPTNFYTATYHETDDRRIGVIVEKMHDEHGSFFCIVDVILEPWCKPRLIGKEFVHALRSKDGTHPALKPGDNTFINSLYPLED